MKKPLRILHVVINMNRGGAETLIMNLYRNIDTQTIQFDFLTCKPGFFDDEISKLGGTVHRIPYVTDVGHKGFRIELETFFKIHPSYSIVHSHLDKMSGVVMRAAKRSGVPIRIAHSHNTKSEGKLLQKIYKSYAARNLTDCVTHRFACSTDSAKWLFNRQAKTAQIVKNGIELNTFTYHPKRQKEIRCMLGIPDSTVVFGHVGRFNKQKNHFHLIDIFVEIHEKVRDAMLILIGDGILKTSVEKKVYELGLDNKILFLGVRSDISDLLQGFDIFLMPSLHEGLPVTLIEAQCVDLPCMIANTITEDADLGIGLIHYLPLNDFDKWRRTSMELIHSNRKRESKSFALKQAGYDITETAKTLQTTYLAYSGNG